MAGVNRVILIGNLGKDPEIRSLEGGVKVANFSLATTETYKGKNGEKVDQTEWHNVVLWRGLAEVAENYLKKGNSIYVEGKIRTRDWTDKDGNKRYTTEIIADNMVMLGGRREQSDSGYAGSQKQEKPATQEPPDQNIDLTAETTGDDLPF
ncbi:MAG: single-stranded DNA-binding protein [Bacteroidales bacterium]